MCCKKEDTTGGFKGCDMDETMRLCRGQMTPAIAERLREITELYCRDWFIKVLQLLNCKKGERIQGFKGSSVLPRLLESSTP